MRSLAWARGVLFGLLALLLFPSCAPVAAQGVTTADNWREYVKPGDVPAGMYAITTCKNGRPIVHMAGLDSLPLLAIEELWAHERVHVEQLTRDPSLTCEQALEVQFSSPLTLIDNEAEAYCAHAVWGLKHREDVDPLVMMIHSADRLIDHYGRIDPAWLIVRFDVMAMFVRKCPLAVAGGR